MLPRIQHPTFDVVIPSTGESAKMRPMLVKEEKILLMAREGDDRGDIISAVKQVVGNCLVSRTDIDKLAMFDIEYMFLKLRAQSVSPETKVTYVDNDDKETRTFDINLNEVQVKFPEKKDMDIKVSDTVTIIMRYPPASLYSNREFLASEGTKILDTLIQQSIDKIMDGKIVVDVANGKITAPDLQRWIDDLDIKVYDKIREFLGNLPTLFYEIKYTNNNGKERVIPLTSLNDFFQL